MSKRYYISRIEVIEGNNGREARVTAGTFGDVLAQNIELDNLGNPISTWALCILDSTNHTAADAHPDNQLLPDFGMDVKVSAMHNGTKNSMIARMQAREIPTAFISTADGYRHVIRGLGLMHNPAFDENVGSWTL